MRRPHGDHDGALRFYWWPAIVVASAFAIFAIMQAPSSAFLLLGGLLIVGTALYFIARRGEASAPEPLFD
jgi:predicted cobalt transporter CbtA